MFLEFLHVNAKIWHPSYSCRFQGTSFFANANPLPLLAGSELSPMLEDRRLVC